MSFVRKDDQRLRTPQQIAREVHEVSLARHLDELASVMTLMCFKVESDFWCPANRADPSSFNYPHDSESNDGRSVGYAQQQNGRAGDTLPPGDRDNWWGPMSSRMSVKGAADVFQSRLPEGYRRVASNPHAAGEMVADVQQCAPRFRYRYAQEWDACVTLLRNALAQGPVAPVPPPAPVPVPVTVIRPQFEERQMFGWAGSQRSRKPINFFLHTEEGPPGHEITDHSAEWLAGFCQGQNNVSYHYTVRDGIVYDIVDTDLYSWSVLAANVFSINLCFAGSSVKLSRQQWLDKYGRDIKIAAYLAVQDAHKYGFPPEVIAPPYSGNPRPGIADHKYVTQKLGIGNHTDVGNNFPWDVFKTHVEKFGSGVGEDDVPLVNQRSGSIYRESNDVMPWAGTPLDFIIDAQTHEGRVEALALRGAAKPLALLKAVAEGKSPVNADLTDENRAQAQAVLDYINSVQ